MIKGSVDMLKDLQGFYKRKLQSMNSEQISNTVYELKKIISMLESNLGR